ncbi:MAG TPA: DNA replication/repair protein RecF [Polyangia bacterium]|nr:DNA replication/repair protein RecF [Polyangia bacterium]
MRIRELWAEGWRNLEPLRLAPGEHLSVLFGDNGQGKTNVLESVYYLAALRSFRTTHADDLIRRGGQAGRARLRAEVEHRGLDRRFEIELSAVGRQARLDGKSVRSTAAALGAVSVVLFVPEDLLLSRSAPVARRRFLDLAIFNVERGYYGEASAFQKVLKNRNALLRQGASDPRFPTFPTLLDTYDHELARTGARVVTRRRALVAALEPRFKDHFRALHGDLPVSLTYRSAPEVECAGDEATLAEALERGLASRRALDLRRRFTGFGPQVDDLEIGFSGTLARSVASQGQLRSLMLALKLAELTHVEACLGDPPVLLLDDVPSELDPSRRGLLFEVIAALDCQTLISVTEREIVPALADRRDFFVQGGVVAPVV